jgi:hypothetical protein
MGALLYARTAQRLARRRGAGLAERLGPLDGRLVFVVGCPRSGTTFLGRALGSLPGFVDLGEVAPLKAAIPALVEAGEGEAAARVRRILDRTRRLGLVGRIRAVEQTPETAFVVAAVVRAFPEARIVHAVRDGRDVVCSLLERGWLSAGRAGEDDAGLPYGAQARFWVEPDRREEFARASDARRAAWAWRRYVGAARAAPEAYEVRYERLHADVGGVAAELADFLAAPARELERALADAHGTSVGRYRAELDAAALAEVEDEAGALLRELAYLP